MCNDDTRCMSERGRLISGFLTLSGWRKVAGDFVSRPSDTDMWSWDSAVLRGSFV